MRTLRTIVIVPLAALSVWFLVSYVRFVHEIWQFGDPPGIHTFSSPQVCVYRAFTHEHGERDGWTLFLCTDAPGGTHAELSFPTWWLAAAAVGVLAYVAFQIVECRNKHAA